MPDKSRSAFLSALFTAADQQTPVAQVQDKNETLMQALLDFGSETEDNQNCVQHMEFGIAQNSNISIPKDVYALKIRDKNILLSDIIFSGISLEMPNSVQIDFPELTTQEWEAAIRMVSLILLALERSVDE